MVTIIGGGIAGTVLAGALASRDTSGRVSLYEQQPKGPGSGGALLILDGRGHAGLTALGVAERDLHDASHPLTGLSYANSVGRTGQMPSSGHRFWLRRDLMEILTAFAANSGAELHYERPITDVTTVDSRTWTVHRNGETTTIADDLIIAADGIDSVVRSRIEPNRSPEYGGEIVLYGMTTEPLELDTDDSVLHFFAEMGPAGPVSTLGHIWRPDTNRALWFIRIAREALPPSDIGIQSVDAWADAVLAATPSNEALVRTFLEHTDIVHVSNARNLPLATAAEPTLAHSGGQHKRAPGILGRAHRFVTGCGFNVAAGHGDRPRTAEDEQRIAVLRRAS
ncbi:FAD-dependent monooxygenase [Nocardia sp. NBC_01730]|uniref:FAD-dependent oxidoreductase n=1 Tax=Nocardia sp. NBC_01730 TaxID=2975998 RepID=UPI002E15DAA3|nr:FAD-dependent monooxygenase [Nocardia sp. NBC_01730]